MKKLIYSTFAIAIAAMSLFSCSDVPAPYDNPNGGNTGGTTSNVIYSEDFSSGQGGFTFSNVNLTGGLTYVWKATSYNSSYYLIASAYSNKAGHASESWAVSPAIDLGDSHTATLTFDHAINKLTDVNNIATMMTVWVSTDYSGDAKAATWTPVSVPKYPAGTSWTFNGSGDIALDKFCGQKKVYVGFKYTSTDSEAGSWEVSNFKITGDGTPMGKPDPGQPSDQGLGDGTQASPYNVAKAQYIISKNAFTKDPVYISGTISKIDKVDTSFGNATYYISDDGTTTGQLEVYRGNSLGGKNFASESDIKVGDKVILLGVLTSYNGTPEVTQGSQIYSLNGKTADTGGGTGSTGTEMTSDLIISGKTAAFDLTENSYGSQSTADESTWYTWAFNNINYKGAKICKASSANGGGIQFQGNASDATKQGFIFNATAFGSDIKTITLTLKVVTTSTYDPAYHLYAGSAAHPTGNPITPTSTKTTDGGFNVYTQTFDLSAGSYKYFTISNDLVGAIYLDKAVITLK